MSCMPALLASAIALAAELGEVQEAERVQPVRDADDHDVVRAREVGAVVRAAPPAIRRCSRRRAATPSPAACRRRRRRRPDVQVQAVFAHRLGAGQRLPFGDERRSTCGERGPNAKASRTPVHGGAFSGGRKRRAPRRRRAVRHAFERVHPVDQQAADAAGGGLDGRARRARRRRKGSRRAREYCHPRASRRAQKLPSVHAAGPYHESDLRLRPWTPRPSTPTFDSDLRLRPLDSDLRLRP